MDDHQAPNAAASAAEPQAGEVRANHRFDQARLEAWFQASLAPFVGPLDVRQFNHGASNPTFMITAGGRRYVMRKKPPGQLLASAHQVDREYRVMRALGQTGFPVPTMRALCQDESVIGTAFYVMDFMDGRIFRDARLPGLPPSERAALYDDLNATLARLHAVDVEAAGLADFGRPGNYFERQIGRWTKQYREAQTEDIPEMERLIAALPARVPDDGDVAVTHGDYRPENVMFHPTEPRVIAVLDWELSTLGHPLADLAYNCILYHSHSESWGSLMDVDFAATGIPGEADYVAAYCRRAGRGAVHDWNFCLAFSIFRLASISQGVFRRNREGIGTGVPSDDNEGARQLARTAWKLLRQ